MKHTPEQIEEIREEFKKRKQKGLTLLYVFFAILIFSAIILMPVMRGFGISKLIWAPPIYIIAFALIVVISYVWRCPSCNALLVDMLTTIYCPKCGFNFISEDSDKQFTRD